MNPDFKERIDQLAKLINEYSECESCGKVIRDATLLLPDQLNSGLYRSVCPLCKKEWTRKPFPPGETKHLFELMIEVAVLQKPILVLVLARTIFEVLIDALLFRLMERKFTSTDVSLAVMDNTDFRHKLIMIRDLTGKTLKELAIKAAYPDLAKTLQELTDKRNAFLHDGIMTKPQIDLVYGELKTFKMVPLGDEEILQAISFAVDTVNFFAATFSDNSKWDNPFDDRGDY